MIQHGISTLQTLTLVRGPYILAGSAHLTLRALPPELLLGDSEPTLIIHLETDSGQKNNYKEMQMR